MVEGSTQTCKIYSEAIRYLQKCYDQPCVLHQAHVQKIQKAFPLKTGNGQELLRMHDHLQQHIRALKVSGVYSIETYLTVAIELKLDKGKKLRWTEHSSKCETTPPCEELSNFFIDQARHHESVMHSVQLIPKAIPRTANAAGSDNICVACKETHPLNTCGKFPGTSRDERSPLVKRSRFCMNFLKAGHMATNPEWILM